MSEAKGANSEATMGANLKETYGKGKFKKIKKALKIKFK